MARFTSLVLAFVAFLPAVLAHPTNGPRAVNFGCGTTPTDDFIRKTEHFAAQEAKEVGISSKFAGNLSSAAITIDTYFHVVAISTAVNGGYVPQASLTKQLAVMNQNYAPHGIQFRLLGIDYTVNSNWANDGAELAMKKRLRKGNYATLNVYFQYSLGGSFGYCYYPTGVTSGSDNFYVDGCVILHSTVPGGSETNFNLGKTVTHEVGHWFGLMHTFQGGCSGSGDSIGDTPAQASASTGCPEGRDSCAGGGLDPIHNYMDYSFDSCYREFTPNQQTRMYNMYNAYRA